MPEVTTENTGLFADDGLLYREIDSEADSTELQKDLDALQEWERTWQMHFHPENAKLSICVQTKDFAGTQLTSYMDTHLNL